MASRRTLLSDPFKNDPYREDQIADLLRELQSHLQETGAHAEDAFGSPQGYAERFPKGRTVSRGSKVGYLAAAVLMVLIGAKVFTGQLLGISLGFPGTLIYLGRPSS